MIINGNNNLQNGLLLLENNVTIFNGTFLKFSNSAILVGNATRHSLKNIQVLESNTSVKDGFSKVNVRCLFENKTQSCGVNENGFPSGKILASAGVDVIHSNLECQNWCENQISLGVPGTCCSYNGMYSNFENFGYGTDVNGSVCWLSNSSEMHGASRLSGTPDAGFCISDIKDINCSIPNICRQCGVSQNGFPSGKLVLEALNVFNDASQCQNWCENQIKSGVKGNCCSFNKDYLNFEYPALTRGTTCRLSLSSEMHSCGNLIGRPNAGFCDLPFYKDIYSSLVYENEFGKIEWTDSWLLSDLDIKGNLTFPGTITITNGSVDVNSNILPELNSSAVLTFYQINLDYLANQMHRIKIVRDGVADNTTTILSLNPFSFSVSGFSQYGIIVTPPLCGNGVIDDGEQCDAGTWMYDVNTDATFDWSFGDYSCNADCSCPITEDSGIFFQQVNVSLDVFNNDSCRNLNVCERKEKCKDEPELGSGDWKLNEFNSDIPAPFAPNLKVVDFPNTEFPEKSYSCYTYEFCSNQTIGGACAANLVCDYTNVITGEHFHDTPWADPRSTHSIILPDPFFTNQNIQQFDTKVESGAKVDFSFISSNPTISVELINDFIINANTNPVEKINSGMVISFSNPVGFELFGDASVSSTIGNSKVIFSGTPEVKTRSPLYFTWQGNRYILPGGTLVKLVSNNQLASLDSGTKIHFSSDSLPFQCVPRLNRTDCPPTMTNGLQCAGNIVAITTKNEGLIFDSASCSNWCQEQIDAGVPGVCCSYNDQQDGPGIADTLNYPSGGACWLTNMRDVNSNAQGVGGSLENSPFAQASCLTPAIINHVVQGISIGDGDENSRSIDCNLIVKTSHKGGYRTIVSVLEEGGLPLYSDDVGTITFLGDACGNMVVPQTISYSSTRILNKDTGKVFCKVSLEPDSSSVSLGAIPENFQTGLVGDIDGDGVEKLGDCDDWVFDDSENAVGFKCVSDASADYSSIMNEVAINAENCFKDSNNDGVGDYAHCSYCRSPRMAEYVDDIDNNCGGNYQADRTQKCNLLDSNNQINYPTFSGDGLDLVDSSGSSVTNEFGVEDNFCQMVDESCGNYERAVKMLEIKTNYEILDNFQCTEELSPAEPLCKDIATRNLYLFKVSHEEYSFVPGGIKVNFKLKDADCGHKKITEAVWCLTSSSFDLNKPNYGCTAAFGTKIINEQIFASCFPENESIATQRGTDSAIIKEDSPYIDSMRGELNYTKFSEIPGIFGLLTQTKPDGKFQWNWVTKCVVKDKCSDGVDNNGPSDYLNSLPYSFYGTKNNDFEYQDLQGNLHPVIIGEKMNVRLADVDDLYCNFKDPASLAKPPYQEGINPLPTYSEADHKKNLVTGLNYCKDDDGDGFCGCPIISNGKCDLNMVENKKYTISKQFPDCDDDLTDDASATGYFVPNSHPTLTSPNMRAPVQTYFGWPKAEVAIRTLYTAWNVHPLAPVSLSTCDYNRFDFNCNKNYNEGYDYTSLANGGTPFDFDITTGREQVVSKALTWGTTPYSSSKDLLCYIPNPVVKGIVVGSEIGMNLAAYGFLTTILMLNPVTGVPLGIFFFVHGGYTIATTLDDQIFGPWRTDPTVNWKNVLTKVDYSKLTFGVSSGVLEMAGAVQYGAIINPKIASVTNAQVIPGSFKMVWDKAKGWKQKFVRSSPGTATTADAVPSSNGALVEQSAKTGAAAESTVQNANKAVTPGCFLENTKVLLANGEYKNIQDLKVGDEIVGFDTSHTKAVNTTITTTFIRNETKYLEVEYE
jgi:hypothetical protein